MLGDLEQCLRVYGGRRQAAPGPTGAGFTDLPHA